MDTVRIFWKILSADANAPPQQERTPVLAYWFQGLGMMGFGSYRLSNLGTSWFNSIVKSCSVPQCSAIGYRVNMELRLICSVCFFKKHPDFMEETLMEADKEGIYSFSTWDYLLPGGTQLTSDWHASLCQQSAELSPYTGRQIASLCLLSPLVSATSWLPLPSSAGHKTQTNSHSAGEMTWSLTCLPFPSLFWFLMLMCTVLSLTWSRLLAQLVFFGFFCFFPGSKNPNSCAASPVFKRNPPPHQQPQPSLHEHRYLLLQSSTLGPFHVSSSPWQTRPAVLTPNLEI